VWVAVDVRFSSKLLGFPRNTNTHTHTICPPTHDVHLQWSFRKIPLKRFCPVSTQTDHI